jgi:hypothetical protein
VPEAHLVGEGDLLAPLGIMPCHRRRRLPAVLLAAGVAVGAVATPLCRAAALAPQGAALKAAAAPAAAPALASLPTAPLPAPAAGVGAAEAAPSTAAAAQGSAAAALGLRSAAAAVVSAGAGCLAGAQRQWLMTEIRKKASGRWVLRLLTCVCARLPRR